MTSLLLLVAADGPRRSQGCIVELGIAETVVHASPRDAMQANYFARPVAYGETLNGNG